MSRSITNYVCNCVELSNQDVYWPKHTHVYRKTQVWHIPTKIIKVCIENMVIVLQNNYTTKIMRILLIVLSSITRFTYNNIPFYLYNGPYKNI